MWGDLSVMLSILHWLVGRMKMHSKFLSWHECLNTVKCGCQKDELDLLSEKAKADQKKKIHIT